MSTLLKARNWPYVLFGVAAIPNILFLGHLLTPTAPPVSPVLRWFLWALLAAGFSALFAALFTDPRLREDVPLEPPRPTARVANPPRPRQPEDKTEPTARIVVVAAPSPPYRSAYTHRPDPSQKRPKQLAVAKSTDVPPLDFNDPQIRRARDWGRLEREDAESTDVIGEEYDDPPARGPMEDRP